MGREADANAAAATARRLMLAEIIAQGPRLFDRFGHPIVLGGVYEWHDQLPCVFLVTDIKPDLRPEAQPGVWLVDLRCEFVVMTANGQRTTKMTLVSIPQPAAQAGTTEPTEPPAGGASAGQETTLPNDQPSTDGEPPPVAEPVPAAQSQAQPDPASDDPSRPSGSIVLTDMDRTANAVLTAAKQAESTLKLIPKGDS